jgi:hypothetical protein
MHSCLVPLILTVAASCGGTGPGSTDKSQSGTSLDTASSCSVDAVRVEGVPSEILFPSTYKERGCDGETGIGTYCREQWLTDQCETFQETLVRSGWPDEEHGSALAGWTSARRCEGQDSTPYDLFTYGDHNGGLTVHVFDVSGNMVAFGYTLPMDYLANARYPLCCGGEDREFKYYGEFPQLDCNVLNRDGEYEPSDFEATGA